MILPEGVTSRRPVTSPCMAGILIPVPWVAVPRAPPSDCLLMSGRLARARPFSARSGPKAPRRVPARTMASSPSQPTIPDIESSETSVPSVGARAVKEWPEPTGRIGAWATFSAVASSPSSLGARRAAG